MTLPPRSLTVFFPAPASQVFTRMDGVWNLSSDQGNLGVLITTSLRMVWFAQLAENFNVSVPYSQMVRDEERGGGGGRVTQRGKGSRGARALTLTFYPSFPRCFTLPPRS